MKFIYMTAKTYPATTADHIFVREMAKAFSKILKTDFSLVVANDFSEELASINIINFKLKIKKGLTAYFYFYLPYFIFRRKLNAAGTVLFSVDRNILKILIFCKRIFNLKYKIISDWHMLFGDVLDADIFRNSDGLITTTTHLKNILVGKYLVPESKINVARGGVDLEKFSGHDDPANLIRDLNLPVDSFLVGYVGFYKTMGMAKGLDIMIEALAFIVDENVKMLFVGGSQREIEEYKKLAEGRKVINRAIFIEKIPTDKVPEYEKAMDLLVIPYPDKSHFREFGFPMKVYEYMASKKPIIYSDLPIITEVLGDCATPFKPDDAKDLADKILYLKNNSAKGKELADRAYAKVANFTWQKRAENIISFAKGIL